MNTPSPMLNKRFLVTHPAHFIALGFGSGLSKFAPGTVGTIWAWAFYLLISVLFDPMQMGIFIALSILIGWWACTVCALHLGVADPGAIVWDEFVAFWLILWLIMPASFGTQLLAFALFRFFDAAKPGPVKWADNLFKGLGWRGGWGIIFDDLVAALCTLITLAIIKTTWGLL
jgi:phosphatidylglycerophosphatase A